MSTGLWERRTKGKRGGETVVSERWAVPTNVEREKGSAGEGGAVELWERRTNGGLRFGLKVEPLSCVLRVGERQSVGLRFRGRRRQKKEKAESCVWGNGRAIYRVLEKLFYIYVFIFGFRKVMLYLCFYFWF